MTARQVALSLVLVLTIGAAGLAQSDAPQPAPEVLAQIRAWCEQTFDQPTVAFRHDAASLENGTIECSATNYAAMRQKHGTWPGDWPPGVHMTIAVIMFAEGSRTELMRERGQAPAPDRVMVNTHEALLTMAAAPGPPPSLEGKVSWWWRGRRVYLTYSRNEPDSEQTRKSVREKALELAASLDLSLGGEVRPRISYIILVDITGGLASAAAVRKWADGLVHSAETMTRNNEYWKASSTLPFFPPTEWALMTYDGSDITLEHDFTMEAEPTRGAVANVVERLKARAANPPPAPAGPPATPTERLATAVTRALLHGYLNAQAQPCVVTMTCGDKPLITAKTAHRLKNWLDKARTAYQALRPHGTDRMCRGPAPRMGLWSSLIWAALGAPQSLGSVAQSLDDLLAQLEAAAAKVKRAPMLGILAVAVPPGSELESLLQLLCQAGGGKYVGVPTVEQLPPDILAALGLGGAVPAQTVTAGGAPATVTTTPPATTGPAVTLPGAQGRHPLPDPPAAPANVALGKPAQQSSRSRISRPDDPQGAVDGIKNGQFGFHTDWEVHPWWRVDLGQPCALAQVVVYNCLQHADRAQHLEVSLSLDGQQWQTAYTHQGPTFGGMDGNALVVPLQGAQARHVRLRLADDAPHYLHLDEVEVYPSALGTAAGAAPAAVNQPTVTTLPITALPQTTTPAGDIAVPGLGFQLGLRDGRLTVTGVQPDSLAALTGVQAGDVVLVINGNDPTGLTLPQVAAMTDVPPGARLSIRYRRPSTGFSADFTLQRK